MKRLFRTSKSPVVDPLPPPAASSTPGSGASTPTHHHHEHRWPFGHSHQPEVTPFPMDAGREAYNVNQSLPPPPAPVPSGRKGKERGPSGGTNTGIPSLLEIQEREREQAMRSAQRQQQPQPQRQSKAYGGSSGAPSPDGWTMISPSINNVPIPSPGNDQSYHASMNMAEPLAIPNAAFASSPPPSSNASPSSASTHTALYLPPGARPATPPSMRPPYPPPTGSARHSQSSLNSMSTAYYGEAGDIIPQAVGRERGHSIASNTGSLSTRSEHDTINTNSTYTHNMNNPYQNNNAMMNQPVTSPNQPSSKLQKQPPIQAVRSPLANSYPSPELTSFPSPHPYTASNTQPFPPPSAPPSSNDHSSSQNHNSFVARIEEMPNTVNLSRRGSQMDGPGQKEKKRGFLGMGWGKGKDKDKDRKDGAGPGLDVNKPLMEEARRSFDGWRNQVQSGESESQPSSTHGHSTTHGHDQEEPTRGRILGLDFGGSDKRKEKERDQPANDVGSAIRRLCSMPDPPQANIHDVCERIHLSEGVEGVTKDAARELRKVFKNGNEAERKSAGKVWLYLMRNVSGKGFRQHASNKKFLAALEPILLAPATKPLVSQPTYKLLTDILSDLTFTYGQEEGCEGLGALWKKVKLPQESDIGNPLPVDHPIFDPEPFYNQRLSQSYGNGPQSFPGSRRPSSPSLQQLSTQQGLPPPPLPQRGASPGHYGGPRYADLPSHNEDIRRLVDECTAAKESARVLSEALVFTKPEELEHKPVIEEFYRKVFLAHESLTNQMDWAQAEAARSRERHASLTLDGSPNADNTRHDTPEEKALALLLEAHSALGEALKQHDDLTKLAGEEKEMREVRERSKKETRMDRNQPMYEHSGLFPPSNQPQASSSRSPSPVPNVRLPSDTTPRVTSSPRNYDLPLPPPPNAQATGGIPIPGSNNPFRNANAENGRNSRTPSPDHQPNHPLPHPPKLSTSPAPGSRTGSPLGMGRLRMGGPRPLPNPFAKGNNASHQSLHNLANGPGTGTGTPPSRNGSGEGDTPSRSGTGDSSNQSHSQVEEVDGDELPPKPVKPSRKALGKRRAVVDEDNNFDPNDMFNPNPTDPRSQTRDQGQNPNNDNNNEIDNNNSSEEDYMTLEDSMNNKQKKKIVYAYDAYEERQRELKKAAEALKISERAGGGGGGGSGGRL